MAKNWAICIGINQYNSLPNLKYTGRDAKQMQDFLLKKLKFDKVYLFTDDSPLITDGGKPFTSQPTYGTLKRFLRIRFNQPFLDAGDNLWFFFSGHGLRHRDRDYLMPSDGDPHPEGVEDTAISLHYVTERLRRCGGDNVVLFLDACRNEQASKGLGMGEDKQKGVITVASCSPAEKSYEIDEIHQGSFTYALLEALQIQGEGNCATVERLNQRWQYRVNQINQHYGKPRQTPYVIAEPASKYHLILLPQQATLQDITNLKLDAQNAELEGDLNLAEQLWTRILAVSPADTQALKALKRIWNKPKTIIAPTPPINQGGAKAQETLSGEDFTNSVVQTNSLKEKSQPPAQEKSASPSPVKPASEEKFLLQTFEFEVVTVEIQSSGFLGLVSKVNLKPHLDKAQYFRENLGKGVTLDMVYIPGGEFIMGSSPEEKGRYDYEQPQHKVIIKPFYMGKFQVTQAQWKAVASLTKIERELNSNPSRFKGDSLPVERVSWYEAVEFCGRLSEETGKEYRLPSEAEWEYACRSVSSYQTVAGWNEKYNQPFHFGATLTEKLANYDASETYAKESKGEYQEKTTPVGSFPSNAFGLYDMHGNVWEWCADYWHNNYQEAPDDGSVWLKGGNQDRRVIRGGSWLSYPRYCRSACRFDAYPGARVNDFGFRVMCEARGL